MRFVTYKKSDELSAPSSLLLIDIPHCFLTTAMCLAEALLKYSAQFGSCRDSLYFGLQW